MAGSEAGTFFLVPNALMDDEGLTGTEKLVLLSLLRHLNAEQRRAWPSQDTIAKEARTSRRWVIQTLKRLEDLGYIRSEKKTGRSTRYEVRTCELNSHVNSVHPCTQFTCEVTSQGCELSSQGCELTSQGGVNSVHQNKTIRTIQMNKTKEPEGRPVSPDPWIADRLGEIRKVVAAPKPGNLSVLLAQWRETYGASTVEQTISKAMRWMQDNRKRYADMGRFLGRWLARDAERATPRKYTTPDYGDKPKNWRELMPAFYEEEQHDGQ